VDRALVARPEGPQLEARRAEREGGILGLEQLARPHQLASLGSALSWGLNQLEDVPPHCLRVFIEDRDVRYAKNTSHGELNRFICYSIVLYRTKQSESAHLTQHQYSICPSPFYHMRVDRQSRSDGISLSVSAS